MALKHDTEGFLAGGTPIQQTRSDKALSGIQADVHAIRNMLAQKRVNSGATATHRKSAKAHQAPAKQSAVVAPAVRAQAAAIPAGKAAAMAERIESGKSVALPAKHRSTAQPVKPVSPSRWPFSQAEGKKSIMVKRTMGAMRDASVSNPVVLANPTGRDHKGRFVAGQKRAQQGESTSGNDDLGAGEKLRQSKVQKLLGGIKDGIVGLNMQGAEELDPSIKAAQEASDLAKSAVGGIKVIATPVLSLFGRKKKDAVDKSVPWYRRMWHTMTDTKRDEATFHKTEVKLLKTIAEQKGGNAAASEVGDGGSMWKTILGSVIGTAGGGGLLAKFLPKWLLPSFLKSGAGALGGAAGVGLLGRVAGAGKGLLRGAGGLTKGFAKKLPLIGALLTAAGAGADVYDSETDVTLTRQEKDRKTSRAVGGGIGAIAGGALGLAVAGPLGIMVGAWLGEKGGNILGEYIAPWIDDLRKADLPGRILSTWTQVTDGLKSAWDTVTKTALDSWDKTKKAGNAVNEVVKSATGIDIQASVAKAADKASEAGQRAVHAARSSADFLVDQTKNSAAGRGVGLLKDWVLGQTSKRFESGKGGAGTVSTGKGDYGGASYGTYQLSSKMGKVQDFIKTSGYSEQFTGLEPGTPAFDAKWKEIAKSDPSFGVAQHNYIKANHFDPSNEALKKSGIDLSGRSAAVQDALWSTSVQFGVGGAPKLFKQAIGDRDVEKMTDAEILNSLQDTKLASNDKLFAKSSPQVRVSTAKRALDEKVLLLKTLENEMFSVGSPVVGAVLPKIPKIQGLTNAPQIEVPATPAAADRVEVGSNQPQRPNVVVVGGGQPVGRDLSDRKIAHVATGGLSGS